MQKQQPNPKQSHTKPSSSIFTFDVGSGHTEIVYTPPVRFSGSCGQSQSPGVVFKARQTPAPVRSQKTAPKG